MDLIYTNANKVDQGILTGYTFDLSFGADENDFEMTLGADKPLLEYDAFIYIEDTEYGGIVDAMKTATNAETISYMGRTWHGILNSKVIEPNSGENYLIVSGDANDVLSMLITRLGLDDLFVANAEFSGINISNYQFSRYCKAYDGIRAMLAANNAKLKFVWKDRVVHLRAEPISDYTESPIDGDIATLSVEQHKKNVNHLICLGRGELANREVIHLYIDQFGRISNSQYYTGLDEFCDVYENTNAESSDDLRKGGVERLKELRNNNKADVSIPENSDLSYDIGDIIGASDIKSGIEAAATVSQKIVKINNGVVSIEYKTKG